MTPFEKWYLLHRKKGRVKRRNTAFAGTAGQNYTLPLGTNNYTFAGGKITLTRGNSNNNTRVVFGPFYPLYSGVAYTIPTVMEVTGTGSTSAFTTSSWTTNADGSGGTPLQNPANGSQTYAIPASGAVGPIYLQFTQTGSVGTDNILKIVSVGPTA